MTVSLRQQMAVGSYILRQRLTGRKRYPLVLMLEPLFRCNLACFGCGKIDYPDAILNKRLSVQECLDAVDECGAPMVAIPGGEPLIHKEIGEIVKGIVARKKFVSLCKSGSPPAMTTTGAPHSSTEASASSTEMRLLRMASG